MPANDEHSINHAAQLTREWLPKAMRELWPEARP